MNELNFKTMDIFYRPAERTNWTGHPTPPEQGVQYWHQAIGLIDKQHLATDFFVESPFEIALVGYACDEGVRRNSGRVGAKEGPKAIRAQLSKLAWHHTQKKVADWGDVLGVGADLESAQEKLAEIVQQLVQNGTFPIVLGGGHDVAYGHFKGIKRAVDANAKIGILNFDAHFDLRPVEKMPNSGTPFNQILSEYGDSVEYYAIGLQPASNTPELFKIAHGLGGKYIPIQDCKLAFTDALIHRLGAFAERNDWIYISVDMDGFSAAYAPGVSAPSPLGLEPSLVFELISFLLSTGKVVSFDLAEMNPRFDRDQITANLAARLVDHIVGQK